MRIDLEVLSFFDLIITASTSDSEFVSMRMRLGPGVQSQTSAQLCLNGSENAR